VKRQPTIIEVIKNPKLFGSLPRFTKLETWAAWLVVLKAIFGLGMTAEDLIIFHRHTGRVSPPPNQRSPITIGHTRGLDYNYFGTV
jgi:hypothetical protein